MHCLGIYAYKNYTEKQGINEHKETLPLAVNVGDTDKEDWKDLQQNW